VPRAPRLLPTSLLALAAALAVLLAGCGGSGPADAGGRLRVVAAEDFWGSLARQLGGSRVAVTSIVANPAADPHDYEPTSEDARSLAESEVSIVNGLGYDEWATRLLAASPDGSRVELDVGDVLGLHDGDNPHQWYSPEAVHEVIDRISAAYERARPGAASYFAARKRALETRGLAGYDRLIASIRSRYAGTPVGASESIFEPLARALGLRLITPAGFMDGIAEGTEPTPREKETADEQLRDGQARFWVYNSQNATPDVARLNEEAEAAGVPIATVTETLAPEGASFEAWMTRQLRGIEWALARAERR
jgi:zinc/manganese transport system substrate-binding protein